MLLANLCKLVGQLDDFGEVVRIEAGNVLGVVTFWHVFRFALYTNKERLSTATRLQHATKTYERPREEAATEWGVGDDSNAKLLCGGEKVQLLELNVETER